MNKPDIEILFSNEFCSAEIEELANGIACGRLNLVVQQRESSGPYAGIQWLMPTAIIVYIGKSYFDGFLGEMGKEHYEKVRDAVKRFAKKFSKSKTQGIYGTSGKLGERPLEYSLLFSVVSDVYTGSIIKLLIKNDASDLEQEIAIDKFAELLEEISSGQKPPIANDHKSTILIAYDSELGRLVTLDPHARK